MTIVCVMCVADWRLCIAAVFCIIHMTDRCLCALTVVVNCKQRGDIMHERVLEKVQAKTKLTGS